MKAIHSFFVAIIAAALLAGCGSSSKTAAPVASAPVANVAALKQAVQTFNTQEGHFPKTLDELVPKYIAKIPDAPSGYKLDYNPATGEVKVIR
jgi:ABC-type glycerol-3-phosphate transport system substrate-binding protein